MERGIVGASLRDCYLVRLLEIARLAEDLNILRRIAATFGHRDDVIKVKLLI
jgi:hypothetical protein